MKKENYFSDPSFISEMYRDCPKRKNAVSLNPRCAALLILDMQRYFLDPASHAWVPASAAIVPPLLRLRREMRRLGRPVRELAARGYQVLISFGAREENDIGSNCGQYIPYYRESGEARKDSYRYARMYEEPVFDKPPATP